MTVTVALEHRTRYAFDRPVRLGPHVVRLRPAPHCRTPIASYSLTVAPADHTLRWQSDPFANHVARLTFPERTSELEVAVGLVAEMQVVNPFDFVLDPEAAQFPFSYPAELARDLGPFLGGYPAPDADVPPAVRYEDAGPQLTDWLRAVQTRPGPTVPFLVELNQALARRVGYSVRMETGVLTPEQTLAAGIGSCRDSTWLLVDTLRRLGLAARFVSGYLIQLRDDPEDGGDGTHAGDSSGDLTSHTSDAAGADPGSSRPGDGAARTDSTDLHAWAEVYLPGAGWMGLDPTSGLLTAEGHIPLAATPHYAAAAPISGAVEPSEVTLTFTNTVRRLHADPSVAHPYRAEQRERIDAVGHDVDGRLAAAGLALTMGGEPTFTVAHRSTAPEWTVAPDGPEKRAKASAVAQALRDHYVTGGVLHAGQGKWYPGEDRPRWQLGVLWRADGQPLWHRPHLLLDPQADPSPTAERAGAGPPAAEEAGSAARDLAAALVAELGLPPEQGMPCYEDELQRLVRDLAEPDGPPPGTEPDAVSALADELDQTAKPVAWACPLVPAWWGSGWLSPAWRTRRLRLVLVPGDLPAGDRLPLSSLSAQPTDYAGEESYLRPAPPPDPAEHGPLRASVVDPGQVRARTALVVEARAGLVHVFLPPVERLEQYCALLELVERVAGRLDQQLVLEGYPPPPDPRLKVLTLAPDPGVLEINVHPSADWAELSEVTGTVFRVAAANGLVAESFGPDGRHGGTGGGSHITLGAATPAESPLLRRPDLLVSMITFWQHHPSLSYLFSGAFVGATSQAPRVDEGRPETLDELEIAFAEIERHAGSDQLPWLVDRSLRHLLTDITGNTHRAEFCLDKLYSPDSLRGRLGLLELRAFEMAPHPDMARVQYLLVRALVARFAAEPYSAPLIRWGRRLHELFLLPDPVAADIAAVVADLRAHGIDVDPSWFEVFTEHRFPRIGRHVVAGVEIELRAALEPWYVLGEEATSGGATRFVDSSVERLQVQLTGAVPGRHLLTCNGRVVPLREAVSGAHFGGVRYQAWQGWSALHPSLPVDSPLTFDLVDLADRVSLGGVRYFVTPPGGQSYATAPVNAREAESRRRERFSALGHTTGVIDTAALLDRQASSRLDGGDAGGPSLTLDLRRRVPPGWGRS